MTDLVDTVARAIALRRSWQTAPLARGDWDDRQEDEREPFLELARAAIEASGLAELEETNRILREALCDLEACEEHYRKVHDLNGAGSSATGRAWDLLKRAGEKARAALNNQDRV